MTELLRKFVDAIRLRGRRISEAVPSEGDVYVWRGGPNEWTPEPNGGGSGTGETNTASNVNVGGVGVFKQKTGVDLEFRGINAKSSKIVVTLDAANNEIDIDADETFMDHDAMGGFVQDEHRIWKFNQELTGSDNSWTLPDTPANAQIMLHANGQLLMPGASNDYTLSGTSVTTTKKVRGRLVAHYQL